MNILFIAYVVCNTHISNSKPYDEAKSDEKQLANKEGEMIANIVKII